MKENKFRIWCRNYLELIASFFISLIFTLTWVLTMLKVQLRPFNLDVLISNNPYNFFLDYAILGVLGSLLGLLLTAYAIFFAVVPAFNKEIIKADLFNKINLTFLLSLITTTIFITINSIFHFVKFKLLVVFQMFLAIQLMLLIVLIFLILFFLFKQVKRDLMRV